MTQTIKELVETEVIYPFSVTLRDLLLIKDFQKQRYQFVELFVATFSPFGRQSKFINKK
jgi:hypothetical protein